MPSRVRMLAAAGGVLLFTALFLPWFSGSVEEAVRPAGVPEGRYTGVTSVVEDGSAWSYLTYTDILIALAAAGVVALALAGRRRRDLLAAAAVALLAAGLVAFRAIDTPPPPYSVSALELGVPPSREEPDLVVQRIGPQRRYGLFVAFAAALGAASACAFAARRTRVAR